MQYLKYPTKIMSLSQNYNSKFSHYPNSHGNPKDFPIDETCGSNNRDYFYAPCDVTVKRIYGVNNKGTNAIWLQSKEKVKLANGKESYVTILVMHPNDDTLKKIKIGQTFKQGEKMFLEGNDGYATGYHFHISVSTSKFSELKNNGWVKNSNNAWVISKNSIKPEDAFWIDTSFTKIKDKKGLKFKNLEIENYKPTIIPPNFSSNAHTSNENTKYYKKYQGKSNSLVEALISLKIDYSFSFRSKIAKKNGIKFYIGTSSQNLKMLNLLKEGKLLKP